MSKRTMAFVAGVFAVATLAASKADARSRKEDCDGSMLPAYWTCLVRGPSGVNADSLCEDWGQNVQMPPMDTAAGYPSSEQKGNPGRYDCLMLY